MYKIEHNDRCPEIMDAQLLAADLAGSFETAQAAKDALANWVLKLVDDSAAGKYLQISGDEVKVYPGSKGYYVANSTCGHNSWW
jgi:hypothetical protein